MKARLLNKSILWVSPRPPEVTWISYLERRKSDVASDRFTIVRLVRLSDLPHLKRGQNQIQHEADVESKLDGIADPSAAEPKSFWTFTELLQCLKCNVSPQLLGVSFALTAHLAQCDKSAELQDEIC